MSCQQMTHSLGERGTPPSTTCLLYIPPLSHLFANMHLIYLSTPCCHREIDASALKYDDIVADLHSKIHDVENFLVETVTPPVDAVSVPDDDGATRSAEPDKAVKLRYALTSAMQASLLACNLAHLIVRPDRDIQVSDDYYHQYIDYRHSTTRLTQSFTRRGCEWFGDV